MFNPVIDVHHHIISKEMQRKQRELGMEIPSFMPKWTPEIGMQKMDVCDISFSFLSAPSDLTFIDQPSANALARKMNEELASYAQLHPERYGAFATLPLPDPAAAMEETLYALDVLGMDGVAMLTSYQGKYLSHPDYTELLTELDRRSAVVFLHPILIPQKSLDLVLRCLRAPSIQRGLSLRWLFIAFSTNIHPLRSFFPIQGAWFLISNGELRLPPSGKIQFRLKRHRNNFKLK